MHALAADSEYVPATQLAQLDDAAVDWYEPAEQPLHPLEPAAEYDAVAQLKHAVALALGWYLPAGQLTQLPAPTPE